MRTLAVSKGTYKIFNTRREKNTLLLHVQDSANAAEDEVTKMLSSMPSCSTPLPIYIRFHFIK
jgi:hypothetical protein